MIHRELLVLIAILLFGAAIAYRMSFFHNRRLGYISLIQVFYLIILPGVINTIIFSEVLDIISRPHNTRILFSDTLLASLLLLSVLYTYGGIAIHGLAKTLSRYFKPSQKNSMAYIVSEYFHWDFSHNLIYSGALLSALFFSMLELNHASSSTPPQQVLVIIITGIFVGLSSIFALINYEKHHWSQLKFFFFSLWIAIVMTLYTIKPYYRNLDDYPITLTMLITFGMLATLNLFIYVKRFKSGFRLVFKIPKKLFHKVSL